MNIILAPHIDDELIGCYSILHDIDEVYYFFDITEERKIEALNTGRKFNFKCYFGVPFNASKVDTVYVTTSMDLHKDHKILNRIAKNKEKLLNFKLKFYSIDMNRKPNFLEDLHQQKKDDMYKLFPSQKGLFDSDEKYFLFEDIFDNDFISSSVFIKEKFDKYIKITIEDTFEWDMDLILEEKWYDVDANILHQKVFDGILSNTPDTIESTDLEIEVKTNKIVIAKYKL